MELRSAELSISQNVEIGRTPVMVRGYDTDGNFVCRLEITSAGVAVYAGEKGNRFVANMTWERLVEMLEKTAQ
jgi:hypothetical protein